MNTQHHIKELIDYLLAVKSPEEMEKALRALLTPAEFADIVNRLQIFHMLEAGEPQRKIADTLGVGIATVSRGARALKDFQDK